MEPRLATALVAGLMLSVPVSASAATLSASPVKRCYRDHEEVTLKGAAFPANSGVNVAREGTVLNEDPIMTDALGGFEGTLTLIQGAGVQEKVYTASAVSDSTIAATLSLKVSAVEVSVQPEMAPPGSRLRISGRGFTNGDKLYAHIVRRGAGRRKPRTLALGQVEGACGKVKTRARLVPRNLGEGIYRIQFDTRKRYSKRTAVKDVWHLEVVPASQSAGAAWTHVSR